MSHCRFENFDITVTGSRPPYQVRLTYRDRAADGAFNLDAAQPAWQEHIRVLGNPNRAPGEETINAIGGQLFDELLQGDARELWIDARSDLEKQTVDGLRLRLMLQPPAVASLPWESLYDRRRRRAFAANERTPLVRVENLFRYVGASRPLETALPVRILLAVPDDPFQQIQAAREIDAVRNALAPVADRIELVPLTGPVSALGLSRALDEQQPDILHVVSHARPDGVLLWHDDEIAYASPGSLQAVLERAQSVKLVFLNACLAGQSSDRTPMAAVGQRLLQAGVPAVIAMQFEILDRAAVEFARFLYQELVGGRCPGAIDAAVGYARRSLYIRDPGRFDYGTPVLWLNARDGYIFRLPEPAVEGESGEAVKGEERVEDVVPETVELDLEGLRTWLDTRPTWALDQLPTLQRSMLRPVIQQRRTLLDQAGWHLRRLSQLAEERAAGVENNALIAERLQAFHSLRQEMERLERFLLNAVKNGG